MASRGVQAPSAGEKRALTSAQVREAYYRRLDMHINEALDAFRSIVASCKIQDRVAGLRGDFQGQVDSSNLCKATEELLRLISDLKVASIVQAITDIKQEPYELRGLYDTEVKDAQKALSNLSENILPVLESLENHYYRSCTTWSTNHYVGPNSNDQTREKDPSDTADAEMTES